MTRSFLITAVLFANVTAGALGVQVASEQPPTSQSKMAIPERTTVSLDELVREAEERNPGLQAAQQMVEARRRRVPQVRTLPDPELTVTTMGGALPFKTMREDPSSYRGASAMQMIPLGGKLRLRGEVASKEVEAAQWDYEATRRRLVSDVKGAYYEYFYATRALATAKKNQQLLQKLARIAEVRYTVGKGMQADVFRSTVEISKLRQRITTLEQQRRTAQARLNALLFRDPESPLGAPEAVEFTTLSRSLEELYELAKASDTELARQQRVVERNQLAVNLAKKEYTPDLRVGWMYQQRGGMPDMNGVTATVNIPVFYRTKQREMVKEAQFEVSSSQRELENRRASLFFEVKEQYLMAKAAEELLALYSKGIVPQSSLALESSMAAYEAGTLDFLTMITNFVTVLDYETEYFRELANQRIALARLEPLVGTELSN